MLARIRRFFALGMAVALVLAFSLALSRVHYRTKATRIGYEIGKLKAQELQLLSEKKKLAIALARHTSRDYLLSRAGYDRRTKSSNPE